MAQREFITHPLVLRRLEVIEAFDLTARMRRVRLGGEQFGAFERDGLAHPRFFAPGFDDHVKLLFASEGGVEGVLPVQLPEGIEWTPAPHRLSRDYTPRRVTDTTVDFDFVLHGTGPAVTWARDARPGDGLWLVGPKSSIVLPEAMDWIVLAGDETALPAIGRFLDERPVEAPAHIVVSISDVAARQDLPLRSDDSISWVVADPTDRDALESAVRAALPEDGDGFVWAAAESRTLLPIRRLVSRERGMPKARVNITGYWHQEEGPEDQRHPEVPSPLGWLATRAALQCGLLDRLADRPGESIEQAARGLGVDPRMIEALSPLLVHHGLIDVDGAALRIGPAGEELLADEHQREEYDGHDAEVLLALTQLATTPPGESPWRQCTGRTLATATRDDGALFDELREHSGRLQFIAHALLNDALWQGVFRTIVTGPGAAEFAELAGGAGIGGELVVTGDGQQTLRAVSERLLPDDGARADLVVTAFALEHRTDDEARDLLAELRGRADGAIVIDAARADSLGSAAHGDALLAFASNGAGLRGADAVAALAADSGWSLQRTIPLGWGVEAFVLS